MSETLEQKGKRLTMEILHRVGIKVNDISEVGEFLERLSPEKKKTLALTITNAYLGACYSLGDSAYNDKPIEEQKHAAGIANVYRGLLSVVDNNNPFNA